MVDRLRADRAGGAGYVDGPNPGLPVTLAAARPRSSPGRTPGRLQGSYACRRRCPGGRELGFRETTGVLSGRHDFDRRPVTATAWARRRFPLASGSGPAHAHEHGGTASRALGLASSAGRSRWSREGRRVARQPELGRLAGTTSFLWTYSASGPGLCRSRLRGGVDASAAIPDSGGRQRGRQRTRAGSREAGGFVAQYASSVCTGQPYW